MRTGSLSFCCHLFSFSHFGIVGLNIMTLMHLGGFFVITITYYPSAFGQQVLTILLQWDFVHFYIFYNILVNYLCIDLCVVIHICQYAAIQ